MDPKLIATQLRCPHGKDGAEVAKRMNQNNKSTNLVAISELAVVEGDSVLEIGPGNGAFVSAVLGDRPNVRYTGIDWSADMVATAKSINSKLVESGKASFVHGNSDHLPFADNTFTRALAVHMIYFWEPVENHLAEIMRVLRPNSEFCLCFGDK